MQLEELQERWIHLLRMKAEEYEHSARGLGEDVSEPSIDTVCNEIEAFFIGLQNK